ncbi:hypothetical protein QG516_14335 [Pedobacter gandavensis]|uniref:hypothetical protein n=1 Tax=Pedobacter TaxID=84567 RepID=UPI002103B211|nr:MULTISPECIES: hypothetical protein [Pedobacter]WGQ07741.1 hypothetical protein QG516_14335 [Pedobacter gandavensis]
MMKTIKTLGLFVLLTIAGIGAMAQDIIVFSPGNFVRGTIQGTNYSSVVFTKDDESVVQYKASEIQEFVWNGATYVSKPITVNKKTQHRFFKIIEYGSINLYSIGGNVLVDPPAAKKTRIIPSIGIGAGTGTFGSGVGVGAGITILGGRNQEPPAKKMMPATFFMEKPGTGRLMEMPVDGAGLAENNQRIKTVLLEQLGDDADLAEKIKATENFDSKSIIAFVTAYNEAHK